MKDMSSSMRGRNIRALGSSRNASMDNVPKFPPLKTQRTSQRLDKSYQGISGAAMSIPPARESPERVDTSRDRETTVPVREEKVHVVRHPSPRRTIPSSKSDSSANKQQNDEALEKAKLELRESMVREKELKEKIMSLQKIIDDLKVKIRDRDKTIGELQQQFKRQEQNYEDLLKKERADHQKTREDLERVRLTVDEKDRALLSVRSEYEQKMADLNKMWEERLRVVKEEKDKEIATRDEKLGRLKKQMADALKGNSWERQQQLDELTKELTRVQEEADMLRMKLKSFSKSLKSGGCANCDSSNAQLQQSQRLMKEKDNAIKELKTLCAKFEKQLVQQDGLIDRHKFASIPK